MSAPSPTSDAFTIPKSAVRGVGMAVAGVVALAVAALVIVLVVRALLPQDSLASAINSKEYQAVFLSNGQVYFGKLSAPGGGYCYLRNVYYLASQASPQSGKQPQQTLIHLGNEVHGPEDEMIISRQQILFVENLKPNGKVSQAIRHASSGP